MKKKLMAVFLILVMALMMVSCSGVNRSADSSALDGMITQSADALRNALKPEGELPAGSPMGDWAEMVWALAGESDPHYLECLEMYIVKQYEKNGNLSDVKATEYHRIALTILALGGDPTKVDSDGMQINLIADGTWNFSGGSPGFQGANGLIYALLVLDSKAYETGHIDLRKQYVEELLTYQKDSGAFCLDNSMDGDPDMTAMAIQALAPYLSDMQVNEAVERSMNWMQEQLAEAEDYTDLKEDSAETCAQVILALCALGLDPDKEADFVKNEQNVLDHLNSYRMENGMYQHVYSDDEENIMATYQSLLALEAVQKLRNEQKWIFDFTDQETKMK